MIGQMDQEDEIRELCIGARSVRSRAANVAAEAILGTKQLRESVSEMQKLRAWSEELRAWRQKTPVEDH